MISPWIELETLEQAKGAIWKPYPENGRFPPTRIPTAVWPEHAEVALDFGCGVGRNFEELASHVPVFDAYDLPSMLRLMPGEAAQLPRQISCEWDMFARAEYDLIYADIVLQHIEKRYLVQYVRDFVRMAPLLLCAGRSYLDDYRTSVADVLMAEFAPLVMGLLLPDGSFMRVSLEDIRNTLPDEDLHYVGLWKRKVA